MKKLTVYEIRDLINYIEKNYPVNQWSYGSIDLWPTIRIKYYKKLYSYFYNSKLESPKKKINIELWKKVITSISNNFNLKKGPTDILILADTSYVKVKGKWFQKWTDPIIEKLLDKGFSCSVLLPFDNIFPPFNNKTGFIWIDLTKQRFLSKIKNYFLKDFFLPKKKDVDNYLNELDIPLLPSLDTIKKEAVKIKCYSDYFKEYLTNKKVKLGLVVCYYNPQGFAFNHACKQLGIASIDIQHGVQGECHLAYSRWKNLPKENYNTLPSNFWCWTPYDSKVINSSLKNNTAFTGGHPFIHYCSQNFFFEQEKIKLKQNINKEIPTILVTLQTDSFEEVYQELFQVIRKQKHDFNWIIRLHPTVLKSEIKINRYKAMFSFFRVSYKNILFFSQLPLPLILSYTNIHITVYSSVVIEAAQYKVKSILIKKIGIEYYKDQLPTSYLHLAESSKKIQSTIQQLLKEQQNRKDIKEEIPFENGINKVYSLLKTDNFDRKVKTQ